MDYQSKLKELMKNDERFVVMTAENRALLRDFPDKLQDRFVDTGITEQALLGSAAGLALRGRIPVVHALAAFLSMRCFEFFRTDVGYPNLPVKLVAFVPGFLSTGNGPTHQAIEDVSLIRGIPNAEVFCPASEQDFLKGMEKILNSPAPTYIRYNTRETDYSHSDDFEIGKAEIIAEGTDVTILVYGTLFNEALKTKQILEDQGYSAGLVNMRMLKPFDEQAILSAAEKSKYIVTIEDHFIKGGLYTVVAETFLKHGVMKPVMPFALDEKWFKPVSLEAILEYEGFTPEQMSKNIINKFLK